MRVAWDLQAVTGPGRTGLGVSVQFMLDALAAYAPEIEVVGLPPNHHDHPLRTVSDRLAWEQWRYPRRLREAHNRQSLDLAYSPALGAPLSSPVPVMAHVHDLIPLLYPAQFTGIAGWYWRGMLPASWRRCHSLTVSNETVANDLVEHLGYPSERIHVVPYYPDPAIQETAAVLHPGVEPREWWQPAPELVFLTLASHEPRKNIELAIRALGVLSRQGLAVRLVCVGGHTPHTRQLQEIALEEGVTGQVEFPGYLERSEVVSLLLTTTALLFISRYEGYGMPPLEALSLGVPVVLSDISCHRHIYSNAQRLRSIEQGEATGAVFVDVDDAAGLATEMKRLVEEPDWRWQLHLAGLAFSATFTPEDTAAGLVSAFRAVVSLS